MITHENKLGMFIHRGPYSILGRHEQASVYLDIFDGGHELDLEAAEKWILSQYKTKQAMFITG